MYYFSQKLSVRADPWVTGSINLVSMELHKKSESTETPQHMSFKLRHFENKNYRLDVIECNKKEICQIGQIEIGATYPLDL